MAAQITGRSGCGRPRTWYQKRSPTKLSRSSFFLFHHLAHRFFAASSASSYRVISYSIIWTAVMLMVLGGHCFLSPVTSELCH